MKAKLSPQQSAVLKWVTTDKGSLELVARAGCGKTFTLMQVVETVAKNHLGSIAIMAYNKSIADELKSKLSNLKIDWKVAIAGTVHSFGYSAWRKIAPNVKTDSSKVSNIVASMKIGDSVFDECGGAIVKLVSLAKQRAIGYYDSIDDVYAWTDIWEHFGLDEEITEDWSAAGVIKAAKQVYRESLKQDRDVIDFDDMILAPLIHKAKFWTRNWVLVDESQDTNPARRALALAMMSQGGRMIFVGDDRQAIYGFTGADGNSMTQLREATKAKTLPLTVSYRCPKAVITLAKTIVHDIEAHESAPEGKTSQMSYKDFMAETLTFRDVVLCRNTSPLVSTAFSLIAQGVACQIEGREVGQGLIKLARRWKVKSLESLSTKLDTYQLRETEKLMAQKKESRVGMLEDQLQCLRIIIENCQKKNKHLVEDLVIEIEGMFGNSVEAKKLLTLSTIHKSKGREWPRVFLLGRAKYLPSPYAKKEWQQIQEANLEYVGITRAQEELIDVEAAE